MFKPKTSRVRSHEEATVSLITLSVSAICHKTTVTQLVDRGMRFLTIDLTEQRVRQEVVTEEGFCSSRPADVKDRRSSFTSCSPPHSSHSYRLSEVMKHRRHQLSDLKGLVERLHAEPRHQTISPPQPTSARGQRVEKQDNTNGRENRELFKETKQRGEDMKTAFIVGRSQKLHQ